MLSLLHIENIAVIECSDISFDRGFNVLTGETGAGKSIVIDAISAILGERTYRDMIRTGTNKASVRAVFTDVPELDWFAENGVEYDSETVIQRDIHLDGKNVCRVNGSLVSVTILRKLGIQCKMFSPVRPLVSTHYITKLDGRASGCTGWNRDSYILNRWITKVVNTDILI